MPLPARIGSVLAITLLVASQLAAQVSFAPGNGEKKPAVYVRDSAVAGEQILLAKKMERLREWNKAADIYQEIVEKYADRVVPVQSSDTSPTRYTGVSAEVHRLLGKWPQAGLDIYRRRFEPAASALLESAGDHPADLEKVVRLYFPTDAAKTASLRLMELSIQNGEFSAAARIGEHLLADHPALGGDRAKVLFRTSIAEHLSGDDTAARQLSDDLQKHDANITGIVRGQTVNLADEIKKLLASAAPTAHAVASDSWKMFGGDPSRGRVPIAAAKPGAKIAEIALPHALPRPANNPVIRGQIDLIETKQHKEGLLLGIMPALDRGEMFYQYNAHIYAATVDSGLALPGWGIASDIDTHPHYSNSFIPEIKSDESTVTLTDKSVLAVLTSQQPRIINELGAMPPAAQTDLVCLDRETGAMRWSSSPRQFPQAQASLRSISLSGSPLVVGDNVYIAAHGGNPLQFDDAYVLCFSLADGKLQWTCYLASSSAPAFNMGGVMARSDSFTHLAYAGGRIYASTDLGAVAAVDAYSGIIAWLSIYPTNPRFNGNFIQMQIQAQNGRAGPLAPKPWSHNPIIVRDGKAFALPSDAHNLLIYDAADGRELHRIDMSDYDNSDTLLGVIDDKAIVCSLNKVFCINWPVYDPAKPRDSLWWAADMPAPSTDPNLTEEDSRDTIRGRGFVTIDSVFIPTRWNLRRIEMRSGKIIETYPASGSWPAGEGPGNVLVTQDQVIIAGADAIDVYSDLKLARAKLDRAIAAAPTDPLPHLKYAEMLFAAGQMDAAVAKLDEAISLLGGMNAMRPGPVRDRVFARALTFAERAADPKVGASNPTLAASLYDRAAAAASSPEQQVAWRTSRARLARAQHDFNAEVRLYQEVLSDPKLRPVVTRAEDGTNSTAAAVAEDAIKRRIHDDKSAYAPFKLAAASAFDAARKTNDPSRILEVARTYPNASVAPQAMLVAAGTYEAAGKYRPAAQVLSQLYRKYPDPAERARVLEAQARNYLHLPDGVDVAIGRLNEGAKLPGGPQLSGALTLPDGTTIENVTFAAAAELLQKYSARLASAGLPHFNLPISGVPKKQKPNSPPHKFQKPFFPEDPQTTLHDVDQLVLPPRDLRAFARYDRVVTIGDGVGLSIYPVGKSTPICVNPKIAQRLGGGVWIGSDLFIWSAHSATLLHGDTAKPAWQIDLKSIPITDIIGGDAEDASKDAGDIANNGFNAGGNVLILPNGVVINNQPIRIQRAGQVFLPGGVLVPQQPDAGANAVEQIAHIHPVGDRMLIDTTAGRFIAVDLISGQVAWQAHVADQSIDQVVTSNDFIAARFSDETGGMQIVALDADSGQIILRRNFPVGTQPPLNLALSPDGTLLYTLPDRICGKDLFDPGRRLKFGETPLIAGNNQLFSGADSPGQLVVAEGRILALSDGGKLIRILSLDTGKELPDSNPLDTGSNNWEVWLRPVGPQLYVINAHNIVSYNLDHPEESWTGYKDDSMIVRNAFVGQRHTVLLTEPAAPGATPSEAALRYVLLAYGRYPPRPGASGESGKLDQTPTVSHPAGINQWQPVEGGFYYHTLNRQLHFLRGSDVPPHS